MKKKIGLLLAAVMVINTVSSMAYGFTNPLKSYNLYEDTHPTSDSSDERETVMQEYYSNSMRAPGAGAPSASLNFGSESQGSSANAPKRRNDDLRESSRKVFGNPEIPAGWTEGPSYYSNPTLESIIEKYKQSNFAGCLQECISYVRANPNDTLGFYYLAMCYSKVNDKENAIKAYEKVISLNANPMIVKYATNGRNCVMGAESEKCYPNVNEPELLYPYADVASEADLTPVDPETLVNRNIVRLQNKLSPQQPNNGNSQGSGDDKDKNKDGKINLPFGTQDEKLDQFINAPYGNGLAPELNNEYKQLQLKKLQESINKGDSDPEKDFNNMKNIKDFDNHKTDSETIKLAYVSPSDMEALSKDPEYIQSQREYEQLRMMLGNDSSKSNSDLTDLIPYFSEKNQNLSPEVVQAMMMRSMMPDFSFADGDNKNLL